MRRHGLVRQGLGSGTAWLGNVLAMAPLALAMFFLDEAGGGHAAPLRRPPLRPLPSARQRPCVAARAGSPCGTGGPRQAGWAGCPRGTGGPRVAARAGSPRGTGGPRAAAGASYPRGTPPGHAWQQCPHSMSSSFTSSTSARGSGGDECATYRNTDPETRGQPRESATLFWHRGLRMRRPITSPSSRPAVQPWCPAACIISLRCY